MKTICFNDPSWYNLNVVIMAGGRGSRLNSLTENKPKPLIELCGKPVIVHLIEHLISFGISNIFISVGYLSHQIKDDLKNRNLNIHIQYIEESLPMGSIGPLSLKTDWEHENFLILNGDIFTNFNLTKFLFDFFSREADMAILTQKNKTSIPWGVVDIGINGEIESLTEKPVLTFQINTGIYIFNKRALTLIPDSGRTEGWEFIQSAISENLRLINSSIENDYWIDIGTTETLFQAQQLAENNYTNVNSL